MPSCADNVDLCVEVARLFFQEDCSQTMIAERLGLSRPTVASILSRAKETGVVQIIIRDPRRTTSNLEEALAARFHLERAVVAPGPFLSPAIAKRVIAAKAAELLSSLLTNGMTVGLCWGTTNARLVEALHTDHKADVLVVPLMGGSGQSAAHYQLNAMVQHFAGAVGGQPLFLHAPVLVDDPELRNRLVSESSVAAVVDHYQHLDVAITGLGTVSASAIDVLGLDRAWQGLIPELMRTQAVGQVSLRCYDCLGRDVLTSLDPRLIAITLQELRSARYRIAAAGGKAKLAALHGALLGRILNVLVTDEETATSLLATEADRPLDWVEAL